MNEKIQNEPRPRQPDRQMRRQRRALPALAVVLALTSSLAGCTEEVDTSLIIASGHVEATEVTLSSKVGGTLEWFELEEGDQITLGREIARMDTVDFELSLAAAEADRLLADSVLRLREAGFRDQEIAEASAQVSRARADLDAANRDLRRYQALLDRGSGTEKTRDDALARVEVATESVSAVEARLELPLLLEESESDLLLTRGIEVPDPFEQLQLQLRIAATFEDLSQDEIHQVTVSRRHADLPFLR